MERYLNFAFLLNLMYPNTVLCRDRLFFYNTEIPIYTYLRKINGTSIRADESTRSDVTKSVSRQSANTRIYECLVKTEKCDSRKCYRKITQCLPIVWLCISLFTMSRIVFFGATVWNIFCAIWLIWKITNTSVFCFTRWIRIT